MSAKKVTEASRELSGPDLTCVQYFEVCLPILMSMATSMKERVEIREEMLRFAQKIDDHNSEYSEVRTTDENNNSTIETEERKEGEDD